MKPKHSIVVGTDFSLPSQTALYFASVIARAKQAKLLVVHCHSSKRSADMGFDGFHPNHDSMLQMLGQIRPLHKDVPFEHHLLDSENPAQRLADFAKEADAEMICIGSRGHGASTENSLGQFAADLLACSRCPVTISTVDLDAAQEIRQHMETVTIH